MQDISTIEKSVAELLNNNSNNKNLIISCIVFIIINIAIAVFNLFIQFKLKDKEKNIHSYNLKEASRIKKIEELYLLLEDLKYFSNVNRNEVQLYLRKIFDINSFISKNGLHINRKTVSRTNAITDYFQLVISDYAKKDVKKENELFKYFIDEFNL